MPERPTKIIIVAVLAAVVALVATLIAPHGPKLGEETTGDAALAEAVRRAAWPAAGHVGLAVALTENGSIRTAGLGTTRLRDGKPVDARTPFEFGSVIKTMTAMILADMAAKGEVSPRTTLAEILPRLRGTAVAAISLEELAGQRSGVPSIPSSFGIPALIAGETGGNPYRGRSPGDVIADAARAVPAGRGEIAYSNHGFALLGQALAARAGTTYEALLRERVLGPLGMRDTVLIADAARLPGERAHGHLTSGQEAVPWSSDGYAPTGAGGWSTAEDLARFVAATLAGRAPGASATTPRWKIAGDDFIGYGWRTTGGITWHDGSTGGFSSYVGLDRRTGRGVVVLGNSSASVGYIGLALLGKRTPAHGDMLLSQTPMIVITALALLAVARTAEVAARRRARRLLPLPDRLKLISMAWRGLVLLAAIWTLGAWNIVWPALWPVAAALLCAGVTMGALRAPRLPLARAPRPRLRWTTTTASLLLWTCAAAAVAIAWAGR
ncbi:CubicO group peptidase (beta-lactamase class C family) [Thermocatellispora tengchongensis]|uniref:CubicO group peptidase (Beta-lactamase class C family) n=1 Tax=Thermocatellispora tengchongensis TaxID=1073253 RepID=A0A840PEY8_9ACTN|nr:serine hydrolase domain-containing protein [Thermocatellispora tengchongensis]MBB5134605.1 CubicO group peptidase (beta-lactamase class C family) [Thermocatellispora tengchongensis]